MTLLMAVTLLADTSLFGPRTYKTDSRPVFNRQTFRITDNSGRFVLRVTNSDFTRAIVVLNGRIVLRPRDFQYRDTDKRDEDRWEPEWERLQREDEDDRRDRDNDTRGEGKNEKESLGRRPQPVPSIDRAVTLRRGTNEIIVGVIGPRGSSLTLEIVRNDSQTTDTTPPTIAATVTPAPNGNGWNNTPVTIIFQCTDAQSGVATCPTPVTISSDGAGQVVSGVATDAAGNSATANVTVNLDSVPPVVAAAAAPLANENGWNNGPVTITFTAVDSLSGVLSGSLTAPVVLSNDGTNISANGQATDLAGNVGAAQLGGINIDQTPPVLSVALSPSQNGNFYNVPVTATFACSDSGAGIAVCPPPQTLSAEGANQTITGEARDLAGNAASIATAPITIDTTPPIITVALSPAPNGNGWNNGPVTAHFECSDAASGVASCPPDQLRTTDGANITATGTVSDRAGNVATVTSVPFSLDQTDPSISVTLMPPLGPGEFASGPVTGHFTCADAGSGVVECPPDEVVDDAGTNFTISGSVVDRAGNTATVTSAPFGIAFGPRISSFSPQSARVGTLVTLLGSNLAPNPRVALNRLNGGTLDAPISSATESSVSFVVPAGAVSGVITLTVGTETAVSSSPLTVPVSTDFTLEVQPESLDLMVGQSASYAVSVDSANGFGQLAALEVTGLPDGVTATFAPPQITAGQTSILTVAAPIGQQPGAATLTVTASAVVEGVQLSQPASVQLNVAVPTTSFIGRTVVADTLQAPLAGVTVTLLGKNGNGGTTTCSGSTVSDTAGNFALVGLGAACVGPQLVGYDGTTATSPEGEYAGVNIVYTLMANQATASPVLVSLPRIDDKETFLVQQNASTDQTYSYETIPGLSVTVYRGTTFTLQDGSRPDPFPLVAVQVPVDRLPDQKPPVPTMMSAFIVAFQPANAVASQPAAVFYPNTLNTSAGVNMTMMTLDPTLGRMVPYGTATVSLDGTQIIPDLDPAHPGHRYGIVNFDWHGPMPPPPPPDLPDRPEVTPPEDADSRCEVADPCNVATGLQTLRETDISISGSRGRIAIQRLYRTLANNAGPFGIGTYHNYSYFLSKVAPQNELVVDLVLPEGRWLPFSRAQLGQPLVNSTSPALRGVVLNTFPDGHAELRWKDGTLFRFSPATTITPPLESITDPNGNQVLLTRNAARPVQITQITDPVGRALTLTYDAANRIIAITDPIGRRVQYSYNAAGTLETVTDPEDGVTRYEYDAQNRLLRQFDARGVRMSENTYESHGRVAQQVQADGGVFRFGYVFLNPTVNSSPLLANAVTDPMGRTTTFRFSPTALLSDIRRTNGEVRALDRNLIQGNVVIGRKTITACVDCAVSQVRAGDETYEYDDRGNVLQKTNALGQTTTYTYDDAFNRVTSVTDSLSHTTAYEYDSRGNLVTATDARDRVTAYTYDVRGQLITTTDALGRVTKFGYDSFGNLIAITDALGSVTRFGYDGISRLIEVVDPLGRRTRTAYDRLSRIVTQTDAKGGVTTFGYDAVGNLTSVIDARGKRTTFAYDSMNRLITRTDPVGRAETRSYDLNGNLTSFTDRRGMTSTFAYDDLERLVEENYADGASVIRTYDASGRLVQVTDSSSGAFTFDYDLANRLLASNGPTGSVRYMRDSLGRVQQRQVVGQPAVAYAYDSVGNLTSAAMAGASVSYTYDELNRPMTLNRANGVRSDFTYDPIGRLMSIVHARGADALVSLAYSYDAGGRQISQRSNAAQPQVTASSGVASLDDANRLVQRNGTNYTYDDNGNLTRETGPNGSTTYTWDARNRLVRVMQADGQSSNFSYDFTGMLIRQFDSGPISTATRSFTLDEMTNVVYQQSGDGDRWSVLTSEGIDSHLATVRPSGDAEYSLTDIVNSTVMTVDATGAVRGQFFFEVFGGTTNLHSDFPFEFTGRVRTSKDLYNYRSRFYSPVSGKFISEDPLGVVADSNVFKYVSNRPTQFADPLGLISPDHALQILGGSVAVVGGVIGAVASGAALAGGVTSPIALVTLPLSLSSIAFGTTQVIAGFAGSDVPGSVSEAVSLQITGEPSLGQLVSNVVDFATLNPKSLLNPRSSLEILEAMLTANGATVDLIEWIRHRGKQRRRTGPCLP